MQSKEDLTKLVLTDYFHPYIEALEKSAILDKKYILEETIRSLQTRIYHSANEISNYLNNFINEPMASSFKQSMLLHPLLKEKFLQLGKIYLTAKINGFFLSMIK